MRYQVERGIGYLGHFDAEGKANANLRKIAALSLAYFSENNRGLPAPVPDDYAKKVGPLEMIYLSLEEQVREATKFARSGGPCFEEIGEIFETCVLAMMALGAPARAVEADLARRAAEVSGKAVPAENTAQAGS